MEIDVVFNFVCSNTMATDKWALSLSFGCSMVDVDLSCLYPVVSPSVERHPSDESVDVCSCYDAEPSAVGTNAVDKLEFANQLATQPS